MLLYYLVKYEYQKTKNHKVVCCITKHLRCDVLLYYTFIIQFAGERIYKNWRTFGKVTDKTIDCFLHHILLALFSSKIQNSPHK